VSVPSKETTKNTFPAPQLLAMGKTLRSFPIEERSSRTLLGSFKLLETDAPQNYCVVRPVKSALNARSNVWSP